MIPSTQRQIQKTNKKLNTMRKIIEFQEHTPGELELISPLQAPTHTPFRDLILKPEYAGLKYTMPKGTSVIGWLIRSGHGSESGGG